MAEIQDAKAQEVAKTINELIAALQRKVAVDGLNGNTPLQYIILTEMGQVITMKMNDVMAGKVINVLKNMMRKIK